MGGSERTVSRKRAPPETPRAQNASGPGEKGERSGDFPGEAGDQGRVPEAPEGNLARLHSGCGGVRRREPPRSGARRPPPARPPVHARPGPLGDGGAASSLPTSELNSFSLPTEMFHSGTLPQEPLNSRQPPRLGDHPPEISFWARLAEIANSRPVWAEASLLFYFHWSAFMSIKYTFWPCCRSGPLWIGQILSRILCARISVTTRDSGRQGDAPRVTCTASTEGREKAQPKQPAQNERAVIGEPGLRKDVQFGVAGAPEKLKSKGDILYS